MAKVSRADSSISDLPQLSPLLIHHFECRLALILDTDKNNYQEVKFQFPAQYGGTGVLYSDAENDFGQSGGPVIAQDGSVIGVTSGFTHANGPNQSDIHELVATSVLTLLQALPADLSAALRQKNASCR
jgi:hypothetical protein